MFDPHDFVADSLSLVTCFQTIEHVDHPLRLCQAAFHLLRPGGALLVIGHNRRSLSARVLGRRSPIFDIEHLQLFSPRSLLNLLEAAGYRDVRVTRVINRYPLSYWARLFPMPFRIKSRLIRLLENRNWQLRCRCRLEISPPSGTNLDARIQRIRRQARGRRNVGFRLWSRKS